MSNSVREKMIQVDQEKKRGKQFSELKPMFLQALEEVRARDENGHFIADDPSTPENEAWVEKTSKKASFKKKATKKNAKQVQLHCQTPEIYWCFLEYWDMYLCFPLDRIKFQWETHMDSIHLADYLFKKLRQKREDLEVALGTGNVTNFEEYRYIVGQVKGLTFMEDEIRTSMKNIEYSDE